MLLHQNRIRRGVIIYHINHDLHASCVNLGHQLFKILHRTIFRIGCPIIPVRIRTSQTSLFPCHSNRMNRHKPDDITSKRFDSVQIRNHRRKSSFLRMISHINRIDDLLLQCCVCVVCHKFPLHLKYISQTLSFIKISDFFHNLYKIFPLYLHFFHTPSMRLNMEKAPVPGSKGALSEEFSYENVY